MTHAIYSDASRKLASEQFPLISPKPRDLAQVQGTIGHYHATLAEHYNIHCRHEYLTWLAWMHQLSPGWRQERAMLDNTVYWSLLDEGAALYGLVIGLTAEAWLIGITLGATYQDGPDYENPEAA